jgi:L-threonylcarbamoyladenylate synthase
LAFGQLPGNVYLFETFRNLSESGDAVEAAARLYGLMRELDGLGLDRIYASPLPEEGLGLAVNDRLRKAGGSA